MEFLVLIEDAGTNYCAYSPDVPGCVATGSTIEETRQNYRTMLLMMLEDLRDQGLELPTPRTHGVTVDVDA